MDSNVLMWVTGQIIAGAAIWGGIRADIKAMHARLEHIERTADAAHTRIDQLLQRGHG